MNTSDIQISQRKAGKKEEQEVREKQNHNDIINLCPIMSVIALDVSDLKTIPQTYYLIVLEVGSPKWVFEATIKESTGLSCLSPMDAVEGNLVPCLFSQEAARVP